MVAYRIDFLDHEGRIRRSTRVVCQDDREALRAVVGRIGRHRAIEIWDHTRVVGQLTAEECRSIAICGTGRPEASIHAHVN